MNESESNPIQLARRHWRYFAPTWCMPAVIMLFVVAGDFTGRDVGSQPWFIFIAAPLIFGPTIAVALLQRRARIPYLTFYCIWLAPMWAVWCSLVFLRAAVLTILGRPL